MLDWLRFQPLLIKGVRHVMVHAGILPQWTIAAPNCSPAKPKPNCAAKNTKSFSPKCTATNLPNGATI